MSCRTRSQRPRTSISRCAWERIILAVLSSGDKRSAGTAFAASCSAWPRKTARRSARAARYGCSTCSRPKRRLSMRERDVVVIDAVRTPIGRYGGALANVRPDDLAATVLKALLERTAIDPARVDDVLMGAANQSGEDNRNVARMAALLAGL